VRVGHAVVLGGGFAGLVTAGALAGFYERVTVVDRDPAPALGQYRRGVPQGRHAHNLLPGGARTIEEIFPGVLGEMAADGAVLADMLVGYRFHLAGKELPQVPIGASAVQATRPFYERHLRGRLLGCNGVHLLLGADVVGLVADRDRRRIAGVRITRNEPGSSEETLAADLVVDAMGRGGRTPAWLGQLGYPRPEEDRVRVDVAYASRIIRLTPEGAKRAGYLVGGDIKGIPRGILLLAVEGGQHMLTLTGTGPENTPPTEEPGFIDFLATAAPPDIVEAVLAAESFETIASYRFSTAVWRHYERLRRFPEGLLVTGDALSALNPLNAQGLSVAAMEAAALRRCLAAGRHDLSRRFFRAAARIVAGPWQMVASADTSKTSRSTTARLKATVMSRVTTAATRDGAVAAQLGRVMALLDPPTTLMRPRVLRGVLRKGAPGGMPRRGEPDGSDAAFVDASITSER
jgi:2-polyprenyl-6-methoxyphenol hydroxylase-like FAD-dependent oxidoreductase